MWPFGKRTIVRETGEWLEKQLAADRRIESLELRLGDLVERFQRFQNRENMRRGREKAETPPDLLEEARSVLEQEPGGNSAAAERLRGGQSWAAWSAEQNRRKRGLSS